MRDDRDPVGVDVPVWRHGRGDRLDRVQRRQICPRSSRHLPVATMNESAAATAANSAPNLSPARCTRRDSNLRRRHRPPGDVVTARDGVVTSGGGRCPHVCACGPPAAMTTSARRAAVRRLWPRRLRTRLALFYSLLFFVAGLALLALIYVLATKLLGSAPSTPGPLQLNRLTSQEREILGLCKPTPTSEPLIT